MRRVIGIDTHRTFGEVVIWEDGRLRHVGRVDMTRTALEGFGRTLLATDEVVIEATGNCMAVSRVLARFVKRVVIANPLQVKAIAHAHVKTDKIDAGTLASLYAAGYLPEIWTPDAATERMRRLVARRYQVVRHRTRIKNEVHSILYAHLIPRCPHADLFGRLGRAWLTRQPVPDDERAAIQRHIRELDRLSDDLRVLDREIAESALDDAAIKRLLTITGVNLAVAAGLVAAVGDIGRFSSPQKLVSYFGLNPRVRQSGLGAAHHGRISKVGRSQKIGGSLLAYADEARGLPLGAMQSGRPQDAQHGAAGWQAAEERQPPRSDLCLQCQGTSEPGDACRRAGPEGLRTLRRGLVPAPAKGKGARAPQSGKARIRRPGGAFSRCTTLRHEVARARRQ